MSNLVRTLVRDKVRFPVRGLISVFQRFFTTLASSGSQNGSFTSAVTCDRIVMDVDSPTGSNTGLPTGAPVPTANELVTLDFAFVGGTIQDFGKNGASFFDGIIANIRLFDGSTLVASVNWDGDGSGSETNTIDAGNPLLLVNVTDTDAELFTRQTDSDFLGVELFTLFTSLGTGWSDAGGGVFSCDGSQAGDTFIVQPTTLITGLRYRAAYNAVVTLGTVRIEGTGATIRSTSGSFTDDITALTTNLGFAGNSDYVGNLSSISAKRLLEVA